MAEGGELQLGHSGSDEDRGLQELEKELEEIREEIQVARKKNIAETNKGGEERVSCHYWGHTW